MELKKTKQMGRRGCVGSFWNVGIWEFVEFGNFGIWDFLNSGTFWNCDFWEFWNWGILYVLILGFCIFGSLGFGIFEFWSTITL